MARREERRRLNRRRRRRSAVLTSSWIRGAAGVRAPMACGQRCAGDERGRAGNARGQERRGGWGQASRSRRGQRCGGWDVAGENRSIMAGKAASRVMSTGARRRAVPDLPARAGPHPLCLSSQLFSFNWSGDQSRQPSCKSQGWCNRRHSRSRVRRLLLPPAAPAARRRPLLRASPCRLPLLRPLHREPLAHGLEGAAVLRAGPVLADGRHVLGHAIALVACRRCAQGEERAREANAGHCVSGQQAGSPPSSAATQHHKSSHPHSAHPQSCTRGTACAAPA